MSNILPSIRCEVCSKWFLEKHGRHRLRNYCSTCYDEWMEDEKNERT